MPGNKLWAGIRTKGSFVRGIIPAPSRFEQRVRNTAVDDPDLVVRRQDEMPGVQTAMHEFRFIVKLPKYVTERFDKREQFTRVEASFQSDLAHCAQGRPRNKFPADRQQLILLMKLVVPGKCRMVQHTERFDFQLHIRNGHQVASQAFRQKSQRSGTPGHVVLRQPRHPGLVATQHPYEHKPAENALPGDECRERRIEFGWAGHGAEICWFDRPVARHASPCHTSLAPIDSIPMIRAFLFDIGNVLLKFDFSATLKAVADLSRIHDETEVLARIDRIKWAYEDGQIDRAAFLRGVFDVIEFRGTETQFISAWENIFTPNQPMFDLVESLAPRFPLYLLSNTSDIHRDYIFRSYQAFRHFTAGTYSYAACNSKPAPEIYRVACRTHGLEPATTLFIDDLLPNIETARALGFLAHHYHFDRHEALLDDLLEHGIEP